MAESEAQVILFNGGTGIAPRDTTFDILDRKLEKTLPALANSFGCSAYDQVGAAGDALASDSGCLSRQSRDFYTGLDGGAVQLAWEKLIGPEFATSGVGSRPLIFNFTLRSNSVGFILSELSIYPPAPLLQAPFLVASCKCSKICKVRRLG